MKGQESAKRLSSDAFKKEAPPDGVPRRWPSPRVELSFRPEPSQELSSTRQQWHCMPHPDSTSQNRHHATTATAGTGMDGTIGLPRQCSTLLDKRHMERASQTHNPATGQTACTTHARVEKTAARAPSVPREREDSSGFTRSRCEVTGSGTRTPCMVTQPHRQHAHDQTTCA